jgi:hypothetical protein
MKKSLIFTIILCVVAGSIATAMDLYFTKDKPHVDFSVDYQIDLQPNGYKILDENGEVYHVPPGQLEQWFLEMNL